MPSKHFNTAFHLYTKIILNEGKKDFDNILNTHISLQEFIIQCQEGMKVVHPSFHIIFKEFREILKNNRGL